MVKKAKKSTVYCTRPRKPKVNKRTVDLNGGNEISFGDHPHNPSEDSILITGFERTIEEYREIGASFLKKEKKQ